MTNLNIGAVVAEAKRETGLRRLTSRGMRHMESKAYTPGHGEILVHCPSCKAWASWPDHKRKGVRGAVDEGSKD